MRAHVDPSAIARVAAILAVGILVYSNTVQAPFVLDDRPCIVANPALRDFSYFGEPSRIEQSRIVASAQ